MGHYSGDVSQALDAVLGELRCISHCRLECDTLPLDASECEALHCAGFARRRIDARHLNAVSRLDHTAQVHSMVIWNANAVFCEVTKRQSRSVLNAMFMAHAVALEPSNAWAHDACHTGAAACVL